MGKQFAKRKSFYLNAEGAKALADIGGNMWVNSEKVSSPTQTDIVRLAIVRQYKLLEDEEKSKERAKLYKCYKAIPKGNSRITVVLSSSDIEKMKEIHRFLTGTKRENTTPSDAITFSLMGSAADPPFGYVVF